MSTEQYKVTLRRWQEYEAAKLDSMLRTNSALVGFQYAKNVQEGVIEIILFWRI